MITARKIIDLIEKSAPIGLAYPWDNSGFLCGGIDKEVRKIYITLDVDLYTVREAAALGADMIVSHHPIMFGGIKKIEYGTPQGDVIRTLIKNDIALYASHTPLDCAAEGINAALAARLGISDAKPIESCDGFPGCGLGRIGRIEKTTLGEFAEKVKTALGTPFVRVCGEVDKPIIRAAVGGGACDDLIPQARAMGADVMVTADMKYHISKDSVESGIAVIDAGHYPTEAFAREMFADILHDCGAELVISTGQDVFKII
ncbi:MAG: Nif3-like dinuclear metal center hexameric protein [Clostridia bacterium]|nr:Nif3-like dinuclear metal center hexameric protein [Clostridia bacterium]